MATGHSAVTRGREADPTVSRRRLLAIRVAAGFFAFVFWLPSLAVADLVIGLIPADSASSHAVGNLAYGILGAILIAPAFASQLRRPEEQVAPLQQVVLVVLALACAAVIAAAPVGVAGAAVVLVPLLVLVALHPRRKEVFRRLPRPSVPLFGFALIVLGPLLVYVWKAASDGRADLPPEDSYAFVPTVWTAVTAMALATVFVALLSAFGTSGWFVSAMCAGVAVAVFGVGSVLNPEIPASGGRGWGAAAIAWSLAWAAMSLRERSRRRKRRPDEPILADTARG